jgi:hypothetical protein
MREIIEYFEKLRFDPKAHLGLGDIRLTIGQQEDIEDMMDGLLDKFKLAVNYILHEIESHPDDSLSDIANDAFIQCNIPLHCDKEYTITDFDWDAAFKQAGK